MKKISTIIFLYLTLLGSAQAQDIHKVFENMPRDIIYGLNPELNEQLLENPNDTTKFVATAIYEHIKREAINSEYISLKTSEAGMTQIRLLPLINGSKIICVVQTVCGTICDSKITFYTDKWEPIDGEDLFPKKEIKWFILPQEEASNDKYEKAIATLTLDAMKFSLSANENQISVEYNPKSFLSIEDYKAVEPYLLKEPKVLKWDKGRFK